MHGTLFATATILIAFAVVATNAANPPYGQLSVKDCKLTGSSGQPVQLRGMSLFWSVWMSKYWNQQTIHVWLLHQISITFYCISIILLHLQICQNDCSNICEYRKRRSLHLLRSA